MSALLANPEAALRELDRVDCEQSHLRFTQKFFRAHRGAPFVLGRHHKVIADTLDRVYRGEITRLIINIPPRFTKTEMAVIHFIAHGFALNPRANFVHASFNASLALQNSDFVREVMKHPEFQALWPMAFSGTADAKGIWKTAAGGGMIAAAAGGAITGFGAGLMEEFGFTGAMIIDDPLKPGDATSEVERTKVNDRWDTTFASRLALTRVPIIVIMQRLHVDDFCGFLLKGGANCLWHHLLLPVEINNAEEYPSEYTHGIPIPHGLPDGPLWDFKLDKPKIEALKHAPYVFAGQYAQRPTVQGGNLFREEWLQPWRPGELPQIKYRTIYVDTAEKTKQHNDYSVFQCWGMGADGCAYLLDQMRAKFEAPELLKAARAFWAKHSHPSLNELGFCRGMKVEDKSAGTGLIQSLRRPANDGTGMGPVPVIPIQRDKDKVLRANDVLPSFAAGLVRLPMHEAWFDDWKNEILAFPSGAHDDQVDPTMDAVSDMLLRGTALSQWAALGEDD
ncbi:MAG: phage terminase large subunit [Bradyrhizobium sp.]|nr:phage terminase large subunit [Bradyrhizobium sp.]